MERQFDDDLKSLLDSFPDRLERRQDSVDLSRHPPRRAAALNFGTGVQGQVIIPRPVLGKKLNA